MIKPTASYTVALYQLDQKHILAIEEPGIINIWDIAKREINQSTKIIDNKAEFNRKQIVSIGSPAYIIIGASCIFQSLSVVKIFDVRTRTVCKQFSYEGQILVCDISHDNKLISIGNRDKVIIYQFDQETYQLELLRAICLDTTSNDLISQLYFLPSDSEMVVHTNNNVTGTFRIDIWKVHSGTHRTVVTNNNVTVTKSYYVWHNSLLTNKLGALTLGKI